MANENKLQDIIQTSLESLRTLVDSNTVIGKRSFGTDADAVRSGYISVGKFNAF